MDKATAQGIDLGNPKSSGLGIGIICMIAGCISVYASLFATGYFLYGNKGKGILLSGIALIGFIIIGVFWNKVHADMGEEHPSDSE